jgi:hypothetical protein
MIPWWVFSPKWSHGFESEVSVWSGAFVVEPRKMGGGNGASGLGGG